MNFDLLFAEILAVDEDKELLQRLRVLLQAAGYAVRTHAMNDALLEAIRQKPPQLLILGADGENTSQYDLMRTLRADPGLPFIPILFIAKNGQHNTVAAALNAGADDFVHLPLDNAELLVRIRAMLRLKSYSDRLTELNATLEQKVVERTRQIEKMHDQMRHTEKLASLGRLAASIAHEINNPLTAILTYLELIKMHLPGDSTLKEDVHIVERQVNVIARLARNLRDFSKPPRKDRQPLIVNDVLEEILLLTAKDLQRHNIQVERNLDPDLPPVQASSEQLGEVFLNLIMNARDAMPQGGVLRLRSGRVNSCVRVEISDTGSGIEPEILERIFEPFFTTKGERGTGLGLSVSYSIIQDHGGYIEVQSQPGQGATFIIALPGLERVEAGVTCLTCAIKDVCQVGG